MINYVPSPLIYAGHRYAEWNSKTALLTGVSMKKHSYHSWKMRHMA
jgi:hypothetical protein